MKRIVKRIGIGAGVLAVLAAGASQLPFKPWVEAQLIEALANKGITDVVLHVDRLGTRGVLLSDVSIGTKEPLVLKNVSVDYSLSGLRNKTIHGLTAEGLKLEAYQDKNGILIHGLEPVMGKQSGGKPFAIPVTPEALAVLPLSELTLKTGLLTFSLPAFSAEIPLDATLQIQPERKLSYTASQWNLKAGALTIDTGNVAIELVLNEKEKRWEGTWSIKDVVIAGAPVDMPTLSAKGKLILEESRVLLEGNVADANAKYRAAFDVTYDLRATEKSRVKVSNLRMPWNGGMVGVNAATLPLSGNQSTRFNLVVDKVSISELMKSLTGERATGTGLVSGTVPVTLTKNGDIILSNGSLKADEPGVIAITPETIPGDNAQVTVVRDILKNLHYTLLSISVNSNTDKNLSVVMAVEGKNPDLPQSRPVRLNVHLSGDVLNLLRQNVMSITDPKHLLEKENHESHK